MRPNLPVLTLLPAALSAQAPVQTPAPAPAAPTLQAQFKAQSPAIEALMKSDPDAALAKVEAMIPAQAPAFDKSNVTTAQASINEYEALTKIYGLGANAAQNAGQWEKAKTYAEKAKSAAQTNYDDAQEPLTAFQGTWKAAQAEAQKNLDEMDTLSKTQTPTPEQKNRLDFLQKNQQVYAANVEHGKQMVGAVDATLQGLKAAPGDYDASIASITQNLKSESDYLEKLKGDKKAYAAAVLRGADKYTDKDAELASLRRARVLDPGSKAIGHKINVLLGIEQEPVHHKKAK